MPQIVYAHLRQASGRKDSLLKLAKHVALIKRRAAAGPEDQVPGVILPSITCPLAGRLLILTVLSQRFDNESGELDCSVRFFCLRC